MLLVSALPFSLYHRQVLNLSQEKLTDTESVQQTEVTRSVGEELQLSDANLYQQLISERQILALTGLLNSVADPVRLGGHPATRKLRRQQSQHSVPHGGWPDGGSGAGNIRADQDPFVGKELQRGFSACAQSVVFRSAPFALHRTTSRPSSWPYRFR